mgnify:CR=1 FL=1
MAVTYNDLTLDIRRSLRQAGIEAATLEARELVCFAAGKDKARLLRDGALYASPEVEEAAWALARRRLAGEPVAYLIGEWEFYGLPLDISESVLIPRPDTETLAEAAIGWLRQQEAPRVLDLCAGSGCLGLAIASQVKDARVVLGELSDGALRVCRQNIRRCGLTGRVTAMQLDALRPPVQRLGDFDCIVSNPPYVCEHEREDMEENVLRYEPSQALFVPDHDPLLFYRAIGEYAVKTLKEGGRLYVEINRAYGWETTRLFQSLGLRDVTLKKDFYDNERMIRCRK